MRSCYFVIIASFFLHLQDCTSMHSTSYNLCAKQDEERGEIGRKSVKGRKKRSSGSDFVVLFTSAGRDAVARVGPSGDAYIPDKRSRGDRYPFLLPLHPPSPFSPYTRNLPFHFFVGKCARAVRGIPCRPSHKARILLQEDSNSAHTVEPPPRGGAGTAEKGERKTGIGI